jgi:hypothetical protein
MTLAQILVAGASLIPGLGRKAAGGLGWPYVCVIALRVVAICAIFGFASHSCGEVGDWEDKAECVETYVEMLTSASGDVGSE